MNSHEPSQAVAVGDVLESPVHDLRAVVLETNRDPLKAEVHAGGLGNGGPLHRHLRQEERFLVREGALRIRAATFSHFQRRGVSLGSGTQDSRTWLR
jgi:hypothetical protein